MTSSAVRHAASRQPRPAATSAHCLAILAAALLVAGCGSSAPTRPTPQGAPTTPTLAAAQGAATPQGASETPAGGITSSPDGTSPPRGGTLRVVIDGDVAGLSDPRPELLDPQLEETFWGATEIWRCCLVRTLLSHNGRSAAEGGARLQPDLAATLPEVSGDGLTWTFHLRPGLHYGPPLQAVEITAGDFIRSFHRLFAPSIPSWERNIFFDVEGAAEYAAGTAATISGLEAPDDHTLVIRLTQPKGDFGASLARASTGPLPPDPSHPDAAFGVAAGADTGYGRFLVSSGPYMFEGSEALDFSVPAAQRGPVAGLAPGRITLVRNPSWDPATDDLRPAYADRIEITLVDSVAAAVAALDAGAADYHWPGTSGRVPADVFAAFRDDPARGQAFLEGTGMVRSVIMNVAVPPLDDVHVRRAMNWAIDKQKLVDLEGGAVTYGAYGHILGNVYEDNLLADYDPYGTPGGRGDLEKARAEMKQSRYDTNGDGRCDVGACQGIRAVARQERAAVAREIAAQLSELGIGVDVDILDTEAWYAVGNDATEKIALVIGLAFGNAYISAEPYMTVFDGRANDDPPGSYNLSMLAATPEQLKRWGYTVTEVPSVDARLGACRPLTGAAQFQCWSSLDQYLMESIVPWVPYAEVRAAFLASPRLASYTYDAFGGAAALDRLAVRP